MDNIDHNDELEGVLKDILFHQDKSPYPNTLSKEVLTAFGRRCAEAMREEEVMSIMRCDQHDRRWDSDMVEDCPQCIDQSISKGHPMALTKYWAPELLDPCYVYLSADVDKLVEELQVEIQRLQSELNARWIDLRQAEDDRDLLEKHLRIDRGIFQADLARVTAELEKANNPTWTEEQKNDSHDRARRMGLL